ncbi:MAG: hypothetical protein A4E67_02026 [Syntrophaceae bacterium PtaB.Bin038]|nr:MAG: hypothetical protein A4E67_02026 [Syntrophaceae bacterium PtaB.Bin038]
MSQSPFWIATSTLKMLAPTEKLGLWLPTTRPVKSFSTMSQARNSILMMSSSMAFILVWNSRQATPSPMSMRLEPAFWRTIFLRSFRAGRMMILGFSASFT